MLRHSVATLGPVDTTVRKENRGFFMYPDRHQQVLDMAYFERRKAWEIIDDALAEYAAKYHRIARDDDTL